MIERGRHRDDPADAVAPCCYDTDPNRERFANDPVLHGTILVQVPLRKPGNLDELSRLILHLASLDLDCMTGSTVTCDGGYTI